MTTGKRRSPDPLPPPTTGVASALAAPTLEQARASAGHVDEPEVRAALDELRPYTSEVKVLGSYPVAVL